MKLVLPKLELILESVANDMRHYYHYWGLGKASSPVKKNYPSFLAVKLTDEISTDLMPKQIQKYAKTIVSGINEEN